MTPEENAAPQNIHENAAKDFKSGFVSILGKPNVGKSTLLNKLIGEKVAIVSPKAQTTRNLILGILTDEKYQIVFQDMPGIIDPKDKFNVCLMNSVAEAVESHDLIYHIVDIHDKNPLIDEVKRILDTAKTPRILIINKSDLLKESFNIDRYFAETGIDKKQYDEVILISALNGNNLDKLIAFTLKYIKHGPMYYDPEQLCDRDMRFLVSEIVREKIFELYGKEIPYSVATKVDEFKEKEGKFLIRVTIYVERESQKGIIIGKKGEMLKKVGTLARIEMEKLVDNPVFLELWVKVREKWKKNEYDLKLFGYKK